MGWTDLWLRLRALASRRRAERDLDEELSFHLEMEARKASLAGESEEQARRRARVNFGGAAQVREQCRDVRGLGLLESVARDLRYGFRGLLRTPAFTAVAVLSLAFGIGATTAIFSVADAALWRMLPVRNPRELALAKCGLKDGSNLSTTMSRSDGDFTNVFSWRAFLDIRSKSRKLSEAVGFNSLGVANAVANGEARLAGTLLVSGNYFASLGVAPLLGRPIVADDDTAGGAPAAVISYQFWERAFGRNPSVIGKTLYVNRSPCVVVGVTPREFIGTSFGGLSLSDDITLPLGAIKAMNMRGRNRWFEPDVLWIQVLGRLKDPADRAAAGAELSAIVDADLPPAPKGSRGTHVIVEPGSKGTPYLREALHDPLLILFAVTGLTLLMACLNLAGMLLARAAARRREFCLRLALGAGRLRVMRQLLCEGALLALAGALAGLLLAWWGSQALLTAMASGSRQMLLTVRPDARVLGFTLAVTILSTLLFALVPALRATRVDLAQGMKEGAPSSRSGGRFGLTRALVAVQIAAALLLVSGAALFTRSLDKLRALPLGFDQRNVILFGVSPALNGYDEARGNELFARLRERLAAVPGVAGVSLSTASLISGSFGIGSFRIEGETTEHYSDINCVGPDFLETMRIPIAMGRGIEPRDLTSPQRVAVISETTARKYFGAGSPVGKRFHWMNKRDWDYQVIGVARDAKYSRLRGEFPVTVYLPYTQNPGGRPGQMLFAVRTAISPGAVAPAIRAVVREFDRMLPVVGLKTLEEQIDESLLQERLSAFLVSLFGVVTTALACIGLYGLVSYSVTSRTREIGLRMALGASRAGVLRMILKQVAVVTVVGLAMGIPAAFAVKRFIRSLLFGVEPADPASLAFACVAILAAALFAAYIPARRAMRVDPMQALRHE
jgi:predicted permease